MSTAVGIGVVSGGAFAGWSAFTMFWSVSYQTWDVGRSVVFVGFVLALIISAARAARSGISFGRTVLSVVAAVLVSGVLALAAYAAVTGLLAHRIVQLPEYAGDYSYHDYSSPQKYLTANYWELLRLQAFSWTVSGAILVGPVSVAGWLLRGISGSGLPGRSLQPRSGAKRRVK